MTGAIFRTDNEAQYTSEDYAKLRADLGVRLSMGAVGSSTDNALAESFNATLKRETLQDAARRATAHNARWAVFKWINPAQARRSRSRHRRCCAGLVHRPPSLGVVR